MGTTIEEILKEALVDESVDEVQWEQVKQAAQHFLNITKTAQIQDKVLSANEIQNSVERGKIPKFELQAQAINTAAKAKEFYSALFEFDGILGRYLGELPKRAIFVAYSPNGTPQTYEMSMDQLAKLSQKEGRLGATLPKSFTNINTSIESKAKDDAEHIERGAMATRATINRLNVFYDKLREAKGSSVQKQGGLLMWKSGGKWVITKVANQGVISEAYTNFLFAKHKSKQDFLYKVSDVGSSPYYSHSLVGKFYKYLSSVTNMPAIVEEDILTEFAQYAVKSAKAPLPSMNQYLRVAQTIVSNNYPLAPEKLKEMIRNTFSKDGQLAPFVAAIDENIVMKEAEAIIDKALPDMFNKKNVNMGALNRSAAKSTLGMLKKLT